LSGKRVSIITPSLKAYYLNQITGNKVSIFWIIWLLWKVNDTLNKPKLPKMMQTAPQFTRNFGEMMVFNHQKAWHRGCLA
jgi:hypothetical protein